MTLPACSTDNINMQINRFGLRAWLSLVLLLGLPKLGWAVDPFTVRDIRLEGLQRVEPGTVFVSLPFQVGDLYSDDKGSAAIRALFSLGLFKDVRIEVSADVLVVIVEERPTVAELEFVGTKEFDKEVLKKPCAMLVWPRAGPLTRPSLTGRSKNSNDSTSTAACMPQTWSQRSRPSRETGST